MEGRLEHKIGNERLSKEILTQLPDCVTDYYLSRVSSRESRGSVEYLQKIRHFLKFLNYDMKSIDVTKITESDVSKYLHSIEQTTDSDGNTRATSFAHRKQVYSILNSFFEYLRKRKIIAENPMDCIERPVSNDAVKRKHLDTFDIQFILECIDGGAGNRHARNRSKPWRLRDKAIIMLLAMTGMRETALTEINIDDVDFSNDTIKVIDKGHKTHIYKMNKSLHKVLKKWSEDRTEKLSGEELDAFFISCQKKRLCVRSVATIVKKYSLEGLGYSISPHKLRAAFCTILYERTHDIEFVRRAVGHSRVETTQRYIVDDNTAKEEAAEHMEKIFG